MRSQFIATSTWLTCRLTGAGPPPPPRLWRKSDAYEVGADAYK
jgi:hypothetical protein